MSYFKNGSLIETVTTTATASGTTTLTLSSTVQQQFTGTLTQTCVLPDATTLPNGRRFYIMNRSTQTVTVNYNGGSLAKAILANTEYTFVLISNGSSAGTWDVSNGSGGATPGAPSTSIQYNNSGALAGSANLEWDNTNGVLKLSAAGGAGSIIIGASTGPVAANQATSNVIIGNTAGDAISAATNVNNTMIGDAAATNATTGATFGGNTIIGAASAPTLTTGYYHTIVGATADASAATSTGATAVGYNAAAAGGAVAVGYNTKATGANGVSIGTGLTNAVTNHVSIGNGASSSSGGTAVGFSAGAGSSTATAIGYQSGKAMTGADNTSVGYQAGGGVGAGGNGQGNSSLGKGALSGTTTAYYNVGIGTTAASTLSTGYANVVIGHGSLVAASNTNSAVVLGYTASAATNGVAIGPGVVAAANDFIAGLSTHNFKVPGQFLPWTASTVYATGAVVQYSKNLYICPVGFTSGASFEADAATGSWTLLNQPILSQNIVNIGSNFEDNDVAGWTATGCATVTNGLPVSVGSGAAAFTATNGGRTKGANTTAPAIVSSGQISGKYSLNLATSGAGTIGDGYISQAYPIDIKFQSKVVQFSFNYKVVSGSPVMSGTSANTYAVAIYDIANNAWIIPAGVFNFVQSSGVGCCSGTFQTASNSTALQIFVYSPVAPTGASSLYLDDFYMGLQIVAQGATIGDSKDDSTKFTPDAAAFGTISSKSIWTRRVGDRLMGEGYFIAGTTTGTVATITMSGYSIDVNKIPPTTQVLKVGRWKRVTSGASPTGSYVAGAAGHLYVTIANPTILYFADTTVSNTYTNAATTSIINTSDGVNLDFDIPIVGWSSNSVMSQDTDTRIVVAEMSSTASTSINNTTWTIVPFGTVVEDSHGAYSTGTNLYTVPVTGRYRITSLISWSSGTSGSRYTAVYKNGAYLVNMGVATRTGDNINSGGAITRNFNAGDTIGIYVWHNDGGALTLSSNNISSNQCVNSFIVERLSGPAVVSSTESVNAALTGSYTLSGSTIIMPTKTYDSHGAYNVSTGSYLVPVSGVYNICVKLNTNANNAVIAAYVNGTQRIDLGITMPSSNGHGMGSGSIKVVAGDSITIQNAGATANGSNQYLSIDRVGN